MHLYIVSLLSFLVEGDFTRLMHVLMDFPHWKLFSTSCYLRHKFTKASAFLLSFTKCQFTNSIFRFYTWGCLCVRGCLYTWGVCLCLCVYLFGSAHLELIDYSLVLFLRAAIHLIFWVISGIRGLLIKAGWPVSPRESPPYAPFPQSWKYNSCYHAKAWVLRTELKLLCLCTSTWPVEP